MTQAKQQRLGAGVVINVGIIVIGIIAIAVILVAQLVSSDEPAPPEPVEMALVLEPVADGFDSPLLLVGAGDGSGDRFVVEQGGRVRLLAPDGSVEPEPFLDISEQVLHSGEQGLLGLAFHPDFADNGRFFVAYSRRDDGATSISEFTLPADFEAPAVEATERALLTVPQPFDNHNGGMLAFDREGMLLAGLGDGGSANDPQGNGQDRASLLGKLLRLDVDRGWPYATPADNGFADDPAAKPEIHAIGLRNPWRFSVDGESGDIYLGDVGQGAWEEVDVLPHGMREASFGWNDMEGRDCFEGAACDPSAHVLPAVAYPHDDGDASHCSVIGGYVYRGEAGALPLGTYLYADYCSGTIWAVPVSHLLADTAAPSVVGQVLPEYGRVRSFGQDDDGELYLLTAGGDVLGLSYTDPA